MRPRLTGRAHLALGLPLLAAALALTACGSATATPTDAANQGRLGVMVSVLPQKYIVERIGGEHVAVTAMVGPGDNPHTYEPKPEQLRALSTAAVYLTTGVEFEQVWMERIAAANPHMQIVDTTAGVALLPSTEPEHQAAEGTPEEHAAMDPHVWTSPRIVAQQARLIAETLTALDPDHAADYAANLAAFEADIAALDADLQATLADVQGGAFMVFHPAWGYFARDYGLEQLAVEVEGQEPSAQELAALIETARQRGVKVIFAQPEMSTADAETIAREIGGQVLLISPLEEDWLANMRRVAEAFHTALATEE